MDGYNVFIGGDEDTFLLSKIKNIKQDDFVILKLTNRQLVNLERSPNISIITNLNTDDLEIDYSIEEYISALKNMFLYQEQDDVLILNSDNETIRNFALESKSRTMFFSENKIEEGCSISENKIKVCQGELRIHLLDSKNLILRGNHNLKNAACAIMATIDYVDLEVSIETIKNFYDLENRLELIYESEDDRIKWYNDSASINPSRTITALDAFKLRNIILIAGGDKNNFNYEKLANPIINSCKDVILIGENADMIEELINYNLRKTGNKVSIYKAKDLNQAVKQAKNIMKKGDVVLFSPGSDCKKQFKNFEERGALFKKIVLENI